MKTQMLVLSLAAVAVGGIVAFTEWQRHQRQEQQLQAYAQHVQLLLGEVENTSLRRIDAEKQLTELRNSFAELRNQLTSVNDNLQVAQERINPEYEAMEQRIRREVRSELQAQRPVAVANSKSDLLRQLAQLDPVEASELMTLQSMYGGFLQALDVDDTRLDVIVDGLSNMIADQNQARMDLMLQMQQDTANSNPRQIRQQMQAINSPETQAEALSYVLTDDEMDLFNQFQASQPQPAILRSVISGTDGSGTTTESRVFIGSPAGINSSGNLNFEIITAEPN